jgi:hypothetical protein
MFEGLPVTSGVAYDVRLAVYIAGQHAVLSQLWADFDEGNK